MTTLRGTDDDTAGQHPMTTLWDTTGTDVVKALAAERRAAGAVAFAGVLTLIVVADERHVGQAEAAATTAASAHPCRLLLIVRRQLEAPSRLDAEVLDRRPARPR